MRVLILATLVASTAFAGLAPSPPPTDSNGNPVYSGSVKAKSYTSTAASGSNAFNCLTSGCRINLNNASDYIYDLSGVTELHAPLEAPSAQFDAASGANAFTVGAGARISLNSGGVDFVTDNGGGLARFNSGIFSLIPRRIGRYQINLSADTTFTALGLPAPTIIAGGGTCTPAADVASDTTHQLIKYPTDGTLNHACGISGPYTTSISPTFLPVFTATVRSDASNVDKTRVYIGLTKSDLSAVTTLAGANSINNCVFRYDSALSDTTFQAESSDGTTATASDTTVSYAAATTFNLAIDNSVSGECDFYVNGVLKVAKSSNVTTAYQALGIEASITNDTTLAARSLSISNIGVQQN